MGTFSPLTINVTQPTCINSFGTVSVTAPVGADFQYSYDGGISYESGTSFTGSPKTSYSVTARQISTGCISSVQTGSFSPVPLITTGPIVDVTAANCNTNGTVTVISPVSADFVYSNNGGGFQSTSAFTIPANSTYNIIYKSISTGCVSVGTSGIMNAQPSSLWYADSDGDGFGNPNVSQLSCSQPPDTYRMQVIVTIMTQQLIQQQNGIRTTIRMDIQTGAS